MFAGALAGITTGALWGLTFVAARVVHPFTEVDLAIARYSIFGITSLLLMLRPAFRPSGIRLPHAATALLLGSIGYVGYFIAATLAVKLAGPAVPPLIVGLLPVILAVIGHRRNTDVRWRTLIAPLAMIFAGVVIANLWTLIDADPGGERRDVLLGIACSFVALGLWIAYGVVNAKAMRAVASPSSLAWTGLQGLGAWLGTLPLVALAALGARSRLFSESLASPEGLRFLAWAVVMGVAGSWLATWCWSVASRRLPLSLSAQLIVAETAFGLIYGFIYEHRMPALAEWIGIALQLVGAAVAIAVFSRSAHSPSRSRGRHRERSEPAQFGMDTVTLTGPLEAKLRAIRDGGFSQVMLKAGDLAGVDGGLPAAVRAVHASGLRVTGLQVLRDFEGLSGRLHTYKLDIARGMLEMAHAVGAPLLLVCSSTSTHACEDLDGIARDLRALAALARPLGIKVAYEGLSWGRTINEYTTAWDVVQRADAPNLGLCIDSFHALATKTPIECLEQIDAGKIFLVQLSDFMWPELHSVEQRITTARHFRVFPGEGAHSDAVVDMVSRLTARGYNGDYSFEIFNDDYQQLALPIVVQRARSSAHWLDAQLRSRPERSIDRTPRPAPHARPDAGNAAMPQRERAGRGRGSPPDLPATVSSIVPRGTR